MKKLVYLGMLCLLASMVASCNKYKDSVYSRLSGTVYLHDTLKGPVVMALSKIPVYFNVGTDTTTYLNMTKTDTAGHFSFANFGKDGGVVYTNFILNKIHYGGLVTVSKAGDGNTTVTLDVYPLYDNGLSVSFMATGGLISNYPFRLYTNRTAALVDSTKFAYLITKTSVDGEYIQYNLNPATYYITAIDSVSGHKAKYLDSAVITKSGFKKVLVQIK
jgi:hypothetical protein